MQNLTPREAEILVLLKQGLSYGQIAERLGISKNTVVSWKNRLLLKTRSNSRAELQAHEEETITNSPQGQKEST